MHDWEGEGGRGQKLSFVSHETCLSRPYVSFQLLVLGWGVTVMAITI